MILDIWDKRNESMPTTAISAIGGVICRVFEIPRAQDVVKRPALCFGFGERSGPVFGVREFVGDETSQPSCGSQRLAADRFRARINSRQAGGHRLAGGDDGRRQELVGRKYRERRIVSEFASGFPCVDLHRMENPEQAD